MARNLPITEFDTLTLNESMQMFKAMIPFLDFKLQKTLSMLIRINEFQQTMQFYQNPDNCHQFSSCSSGNTLSFGCSLNDILANEQLVTTVLQYCPEKYATLFQNFQQFSKMSEIMNMMNSGNTGNDYFGPNAADIFSKFTSFTNSQTQSSDSTTQSQNSDMQSQNSGYNNPDRNENENSNSHNSTQSYTNSVENDSKIHKNMDSNHSNTNRNINKNTSKTNHNFSKFSNSINPTDIFSSVMTPEQQKLYQQYVSELDQIDFDSME